jgi:ribokinase
VAKPKIVVVGSSNTDLIVKADRIPRPGETILGGAFHIAAGGKGANQAVAAARAGGDVAFIGRLGADDFGDRALRGFAADRIDTSRVVRDPKAPSGIALILVDRRGENSIAVASGANARLSPADVRKSAPEIKKAGAVLLQLEIPMPAVRTAVALASAARVRIILNPAPARRLDDALLEDIVVLTPNETEAEILTGMAVRTINDLTEAARRLRNRGVGTVLITLGPKGVFVADAEDQDFMPAFKVKAVDSTGAGDVFNGALAVALAEGRPLRAAARFANAAAALSVTKLGAQPSAPTRAAIERFLKSGRSS